MNEWIQWNGGLRPVGRYDKVDVTFRDGTVAELLIAVNVGWVHEDESYDVVAYRLSLSASDTTEETKQTEPDMVNAPPHYKQGSIECIEAIRAALTAEEFRRHCKANAIKYIWREAHNGGDESLRKAIWYLEEALK